MRRPYEGSETVGAGFKPAPTYPEWSCAHVTPRLHRLGFVGDNQNIGVAFMSPLVMPLLSRPCNPVNYRAGTGAPCKQQEKNRRPVKGEIYSEPSPSIWTG